MVHKAAAARKDCPTASMKQATAIGRIVKYCGLTGNHDECSDNTIVPPTTSTETAVAFVISAKAPSCCAYWLIKPKRKGGKPARGEPIKSHCERTIIKELREL